MQDASAAGHTGIVGVRRYRTTFSPSALTAWADGVHSDTSFGMVSRPSLPLHSAGYVVM